MHSSLILVTMTCGLTASIAAALVAYEEVRTQCQCQSELLLRNLI